MYKANIAVAKEIQRILDVLHEMDDDETKIEDKAFYVKGGNRRRYLGSDVIAPLQQLYRKME